MPLFFPVAAEISKDPNNVTAVERQDVVFSCFAEGNPSPTVTWTKNEARLNVTANSRLTFTQTNNNHSLIIKTVHRADSGQYRCVAKNNSLGGATSSAATLQVYCKY